MTDEQLIHLLRETPREELLACQIAELRRRLSHSAELRQALADDLRLEQMLGDALGRMQVPLDWIFKRSAAPRSGGLARLYGWGAFSAIVLMIVSVGLVIGLRRHDELPRQVAARDDGHPVAESGNETPAHDAGVAAPGAGSDNRARTADKPAADEPAPDLPREFVDSGKAPGTERNAVHDEAAGHERPAPEAGDPGRPFSAFCFDEPPANDAARREAWMQWLKPLEEGRLIDVGGTTPGKALSGPMKLAAALDRSHAVRLLLADHDQLKLHCWSGAQGITLEYSERPLPAWAAYAATRQGDEWRPRSSALVATDSGRYRRTRQGTLELRYQDGALVLSRGDVPLIVAPLPEAPEHIVFDGRATLRALDVVTSEPFPLAGARRRNRLAGSTPPAALEWRRHLAGAGQWNPLAEGPMELLVEDASEPVWAGTRINDAGLREVVFEIENPVPGSGVYLGDEKGHPLYQVGFFQLQEPDRSPRSRRIGFNFSAPGETRTTLADERSPGPRRLVGQRHWLRLVFGGGSLKCWTSGDGIHWGLALEPMRQLNQRYSTAGVYCLPGGGTRSIRLRRLEARRLAMIESLAPAALAERALALTDAPDLAIWQTAVLESQPSDVDPTDWWSACAVRTLAAGPSPRLANALVTALAAKALAFDNPLAERLQLLDEAALIVDAGDPAGLAGFASLYDQLGRALLRQGYHRPYSLVRQHLMASPVATPLDLDVAPSTLVRAELFELAYGDDWEALDETCRALRFFGVAGPPSKLDSPERHALLALVDWCQQLAAAQLPPRLGGGTAGRPAWQHPWVEQVGKEGYNLLTELASALDARAYRDACQVIANAAAPLSEGLLPDAVDPRLFVSLPAAVELAVREHPELARALRDGFGQTALSRLRRVAADDDVMGVRAIASQFHGTTAAAEAQRWLGDRALAGGQFTRAEAHYAAALRSASAPEQRQLAARLRLTAAMLGRDVGTPPLESVLLADGRLTPDEFERLVAEMRALRAPAASTPPVPSPDKRVPSPDKRAPSPDKRVSSPDETGAAVPPPARYELRPWTTFEAAARNASLPAADDTWGRPLAVTVAPPLVIVAAPARMAAYDLADGVCRWTFTLDAAFSANLSAASAPMRPLVVGQRLFARQSTAQGSELFALDAATGQLLWRQAAAGQVMADPLWIEDQLFAPVVTAAGEGFVELALATFDPASGELRERYPLARFHDAFGGVFPCHARQAGELIVIAAAGTTMTCDRLGRPRWLRRHLWFPASLDGEPASFHSPLLVDGELVYGSQPGVRSVECIELATGRLRWQRVLADLDHVVGLAAGRLIARTRTGWVALDLRSGRPAWYRDDADSLEASIRVGDGTLLLAQRDRIAEGGVRLIWLEAGTGRERARWTLPIGPRRRVAFGPLFMAGERIFCGVAGDAPASLEIMELVNAGALP